MVEGVVTGVEDTVMYPTFDGDTADVKASVLTAGEPSRVSAEE